MAGGSDDDLDEPPTTDQIDAEVRQAVYRTFAEGRVPRRSFVARALRLPFDEVRRSYDRLAAARVFVLQPGSGEVLMAMPFSAVPTPFRVEGPQVAWWAACAWDALGIAAATSQDVRITTACADCQAPMVVHVRRGSLVEPEGVAHVAVPAAHWWDDIGFTGATLRLFRSEEHVQRWAHAAGLAPGAILPLTQLWALARAWYYDRLSPSWQRKPIEELQAVLERVGLTGPFWALKE